MRVRKPKRNLGSIDVTKVETPDGPRIVLRFGKYESWISFYDAQMLALAIVQLTKEEP